MKFDLNILQDYLDKGLIIKNDHPTLDLTIWNYSRTCQFDRVWDDITLWCRGLVLDSEGNVVARPFKKFFNFEEIPEQYIPNEPYEIYNKEDGSLIIAFVYKGQFLTATRGSFESTQAVAAMKVIKEDMLITEPEKIFLEGFTYLFEYVAPDNMIVVPYDKRHLIALGIMNNDTAEDLDYKKVVALRTYGFKIVSKYYFGTVSIPELRNHEEKNKEGFVIRFKSGFRLKVKFEEYVRLHRLVTNLSSIDIWKTMKEKTNINELLDRVPDEFDQWVRMVMLRIKTAYDFIETTALDIYETRPKVETKKEYADWVETKENYLKPILYRLYDGKDYQDYIWLQVRPKFVKPGGKMLYYEV